MKTDQPILHEEAEIAGIAEGTAPPLGKSETRGATPSQGDSNERDALDTLRRLVHPADEAIFEIYMGGGYY